MRLSFLVFFLISCTCFAQRQYNFDHLLEYRFISLDPAKNKMVYYLTNSKDNSYYAQLEVADSLHYKVNLVEQDQLNMQVEVKKEDLNKAENLVIQCRDRWNTRNHFKFRIREYEFTTTLDTLIRNKSLKHYKLLYTASRKRKKTNHIGTNHYIIRDSTEFHLPLLTHPTAYEEWKEERNIPNGIFMEKIFYNFMNEIQYKYILKAYHPLWKSISIKKKCLGE